MKAVTRVLSVTVGLALSLGAALVQPPAAEAVSASAKTSFITSLVSAAQKTQRKFGVPAAVTMAQAIEASEWGTSSVATKAKNYFDTRCSASMTAAQFAKLAEAQVGKPYVLGAEAAISNPDPPKFDCSELVQWLFGRAGNPITDLAAAQYNVTKKVSGSPAVGDLVFLRNNPARSNGIGHVAVLTKKKSDGDWEIIEARGRAYGVVKSTLSYWKKRSYYAGLRRYSKFVLANGESVTASAAKTYQASCITIGSTKYASFSSMTNSFYANAAAITSDSSYAAAEKVMANPSKFVDALAKVVAPKAADDYAKELNDLIDTYHLTDYNVVPITLELESGDTGSRVTALQYLLNAAGYSVKVTGTFDSATTAAVKKLQKAKKLDVDGQAGQYTLTALFAKLSSGTSGARTSALNALLSGLGFGTGTSADFGASTLAAVKSFQTTAGRNPSGTVDTNTWAALFMALNSSAPKISGTAKVGQSLKATPGTWGPGSVDLAYQWYRGDTAVSGADRASYTAQAADAGASLKVVVTGTRTGYTVTARTSAATAKVENIILTATPTPKVSGTAAVGKTLTASAGTWAPAPVTLAYQWNRGDTAIKGATKASYTLQAADLGARLTVTVTGSRKGYISAAKTSDATEAVVKGTLSGKTPTIANKRNVGVTLVVNRGSWSPSGIRFTYQWYRDGKAISKATKSSYKLTKSDKGKRVAVTVTGTRDGYETLAKRSANTRKVT